MYLVRHQARRISASWLINASNCECPDPSLQFLALPLGILAVTNDKHWTMEIGYGVAASFTDYSLWMLDTQSVRRCRNEAGDWVTPWLPNGALPAGYSPTRGREAAAELHDSVAQLGQRTMLGIARNIKATSYYGCVNQRPCHDPEVKSILDCEVKPPACGNQTDYHRARPRRPPITVKEVAGPRGLRWSHMASRRKSGETLWRPVTNDRATGRERKCGIKSK